MTKDKVISLFKILRDNDPEPVTELTFKSHYQLLVAVILSAQATDKSVNAATSKLFKDAPTPEKIFKLGVRKLKTYIKTIGLYNAKAINVVATSEIIWKEYKNKIPRTREELMKLPGVGRKTANVVLNNAFGQHTIGVDTHVFRVSNRLGLAPGKTVEIVAYDLKGNKAVKTFQLNRSGIEQASGPQFASLNPSGKRVKPNPNALALIIGVADCAAISLVTPEVTSNARGAGN